jgi:DNA polymerase-3 subunit alpha
MPNMAHLHMHSQYSLLDSISKVKDIVQRLKEYGHTAAALTEHGNIHSAPEFAAECKKAGIKYIPACEFYFVPDAEKHKQESSEGKSKRYSYHLILLGMNDNGWKNIKLLNTEANKNFYYVPRLDYKLLEKYSDDLICLTACMKGIVPHNLSEGNFDAAALHAKNLKGIFGDRFYLEVQDGGLDIQPTINTAMRALGKHLEIPIVGCQDAHYIDRNDVELHEAIWAIRTRDTLDEPTEANGGSRMYYSTREYWLKDFNHILHEELTTEKGQRRKTTITQQELEMSAVIADRIGNVSIEPKMHLPKYEFIPEVGCASYDSECKTSTELVGKVEDRSSINYLMTLGVNGYYQKFGHSFFNAPDAYQERLRKEFADIKEANLADYFLIIWDIVSWARKQGIPIGPGRGSVGGSLLAYCLSITQVDPIKYDLIWERFYNAGRKGSLADIDLDFSKRRIDEVVEYIKKRFGEDRVAQIVTFNTLATKAALKDTAKLLGKDGLSFEDANVMTRYVEDKVKNIDDAISKNDKLKGYSDKHPRLFRIAKGIEGAPKSTGRHPAGILINDEPFDTGSIPLRWDTKEEALITEWDFDTLDKLGHMKVDALSLNTLDILDDVAKDVNNGLI